MIFYGALVATVGYIAYLELSPGLGNIWWRNGQLMPMSILRMAIYALREPRIWLPDMWDLNYFVWLGSGILITRYLVPVTRDICE